MNENDVSTLERRNGVPRARARFLAQAIELEEQGSSAIVHGAVLAVGLALAAAIFWAWATRIGEVAVAPGEVVPAGLIHDVQHLEGGIVSEIHVRNGDTVHVGDALLRFAPAGIQSELNQTLIRRAVLQMDAERLAALIEGRELEFGKAGRQHPVLAQKQSTMYLAQLASHETELSVIDAQILRRQKELERLENQAASMEKELALLAEQASIRSELTRKSIVSRTDLLAAQTRLAEVESERHTILDGVIVARSALEEAEQRRLEAVARFNKELRVEVRDVVAKLAEVEQAVLRLEERASRLQVNAPVDGIVQGLSITRINAVVKAGQVIMQIVPVEEDLVVEARISPNDIGHVRTGQNAEVKVDSYDSSRYGSLFGELRRISPSTYLDAGQQPYYLAEIGLEKAWLGEDPNRHRLLPGMTVAASIKTGSKTVLEYLLRPISRGLDSAFHER
jgi:HlyD family type I secretion membrane fusion protein